MARRRGSAPPSPVKTTEARIDPVFALLVASRWIHFVSISVVFGSSFFWFYIGGRRASTSLRGLPVTTAGTMRLLRVGALLAAVSGVAWLAATIVNVTDDPASVLDRETLQVFFFETPFGPPSLARLALLAILAAAAVMPSTPLVAVSMDAVVAATLLVSQAWQGHAAEAGISPYGLMMIGAYAIHVVGAAAWVGGLPALALTIAERWRRDEGSLDVLARYSAMAVIAVGLIVISGIANTLFHAGGELDGLAASSYGKILFAKLALVAAMLVLAAINRFMIMPRLHEQRRAGGLTRTLRRSVALEAFLAVLVLGAAAVLGITPPPH